MAYKLTLAFTEGYAARAFSKQLVVVNREHHKRDDNTVIVRGETTAQYCNDLITAGDVSDGKAVCISLEIV